MIREFLDWWLTQLKAWLPDSLKSRLRQEFCLLYLDVERDHVNVHASYQNRQHPYGQIDNAETGEENPGLQRFITSLPRRPDRILVRIGQGRYLSRQVELPLAAEENLAETLSFQLEQLTPFSADQVLCFSGISERLTAQKKLRAWLAVTPTEQVDQVLQLLGGTPPIPARMPNHAPARGERLEIAFRPYGQTDGGSFRSTWLMAILLLLVLGGVFALHVNNRVQTRDHLQQELSEVRKQAGQANRLRQRIQALQDQASQLARAREQAPDFMPLWEELSQRLDDNTWLQRIDLRGKKITLQGISGNATGLIELLEASPLLRSVSFGASVTRDRTSDKERFNISASLTGRTGGDS